MLASIATSRRLTDGARFDKVRHGSVILVAFGVLMTVAMLVPFATILIMTLAMILVVAITIMLHVLLVVPAILDEVNRLSTGVISPAVLTPVIGVARRYAEVNRLAHHLAPG